MTRAALRTAALAAVAIIAAVAVACADDEPSPTTAQQRQAQHQKASPPPQEQQQAPPTSEATQQDAQTTEYVADVSQDTGWPILPLTASEKASFCEDLEAAASLSQMRRALWNAGHGQHAVREAMRNSILSGQRTAASMLDLYYEINPPLNAIFLRLATLFESMSATNATAVEAYDKMEASDRQLASLVHSAWAAVADYCRR